jgi:hypothetical protein
MEETTLSVDPESPDVQLAVFGRQVELFLETEIGQYLVQCAEQEISEALNKLKDADAEDPKLIRALQAKVKVGEFFIGWLQDAVKSGTQAKELLEERQ